MLANSRAFLEGVPSFVMEKTDDEEQNYMHFNSQMDICHHHVHTSSDGMAPFPNIVFQGRCLFFFSIKYAIMTVAINFTLPLLVILVLNISIFCIANKYSRPFEVRCRVQGRRHPSVRGRDAVNFKTNTKTARNFKTNMKAVKVTLLLAGVFMLSWLPYIIVVAINISCRGCVPRKILWVTILLNYSSAATNPILYGLLNNEILSEARKVSSKIIRKRKRKDLNTH